MVHDKLVLGYAGIVSFFFSSRRRHTRLQGDWSSECALPISESAQRVAHIAVSSAMWATRCALSAIWRDVASSSLMVVLISFMPVACSLAPAACWLAAV